jgi:integrase
VSDTGRRGDHLRVFFACLYFAGLRPSEAIALRVDNCELPNIGWGRLILTGSDPRAGADWTDDRNPREARELKRRGMAATRVVPIPPELMAILREHIAGCGIGGETRLFRSESGSALHETSYYVAWRKARASVLSVAQQRSPLARRPYDLRHAAASLWLNAGVAPTEVARRRGHSVAILLKVYANCLDTDEGVGQ